MLGALPVDRDRYGLIHFDFELDNLYWRDQTIGMLDFDDCAHYWYAADIAFWLKLCALMLLGVNAALFYLTGVFDGVDRLGPGEDATLSAKVIAASSLVLWFAVIITGRYIQRFEDSLRF